MLAALARSESVVLALHGVVKLLRVGVPGCCATLRVLAGVDLVVLRGERVVVVGPRGSGKSTLVLVAAGVLRPDAGQVWCAPGVRLSYDESWHTSQLRG